MIERKLIIKEKKPYNSWKEREKAKTKQTIKQKLSENSLSYEELSEKSKKLQKEYEELKDKLDEIEGEIINAEYLRIMLVLMEMIE